MPLVFDPYRDILGKLAGEKVDFVVAGGVACVLHGVERITMDIDLAVSMKLANFEKFLAVLKACRLVPRAPVIPSTLVDPKVRARLVAEKHAIVFSFVDPDQPLRQVDLFLEPHLSFDSLKADTEWVDMNDFSLRVLTRKKLLSLKLAIDPPRPKDVLDIEYLRKSVS